MKLLILLGKFSSGGTERIVSYLTHYAPEEIRPVIIIDEPRVDYPYRGELRHIVLPAFTRRKQYYLHVARFARRLFDTYAIAREVKPDVVLAFTPRWGLLAALLSYPFVFSFQTTPSTGFGTTLLRRLQLRFICARASSVLCVSKGVKRDLEIAFGIYGAQVIYNPIDESLIAHMRKEEPADLAFRHLTASGSFIFIAVGRSSPAKGYQHLMRAFAKTRAEQVCKLVVMGEGVDRDLYLRRLIEELGIAEDVLLLGFQENPFAYLSRASVFVLSSIREGLPLVCGEAMACGLSVISADCRSGPREILAPNTSIGRIAIGIERGKYGILTPPLDGESYGAHDPLTASESLFAEAMLLLARDNSLREHYATLSMARSDDFGMDAFIANTMTALRSAASARLV